MRRALTIAVLAAGVSGLAGCAPPAPLTDAARARADIQMLAGTIGRRPAGSNANARARAYLVDQLHTTGFDVRVQQADAVNDAQGVTVRVQNIIAVRAGSDSRAIALMAHYDSVPDGPGAADDALGVATVLASARTLVAGGPLTHTLFVIFTDGEELGLMGARAVVRDPGLAGVRAWINFDRTGADGPSLMYETTGSDALAAWAAAAPYPRGASWNVEIYKRLPNDTDFSVVRPIGATGINVGTVVESYGHHTDRDVAARITDRVIQEEGDNTVATVRALDRSRLDSAAPLPTYFDLGGRRVVHYGSLTERVITDVAVLAGGTAWLSVLVLVWRAGGARAVFVSAFWAAVAIAAGTGGAIAAVAALRAARLERQPWYAHPAPFFVLVTAGGLLAGWIVLAWGRRVPDRFRPSWSSASVWMVALPLWIALALVTNHVAPQIAFLFMAPLAAAAFPLALPVNRPVSIIAASVLSGVAIALLWMPGGALLLKFVVPLFGWLPVVTPAWVYPGLFVALGIGVLPPVVSLVAAVPAGARTERAHALAGAALAVIVIVSGTMAATTPAYTSDRPLRREVRYVQDEATGRAWWEMAANEPGRDVGPGAPASWQSNGDALPAGVPIRPLVGPMRLWTETKPAIEIAPIRIAVARAAEATSGHRRWDLTIVPRENLAVRVSLPRGLRPLASSLAGVVVNGVWSATFVAVPIEGITLSVTLPDAGDRLDATIACITDHLPGAPFDGRLPPWLSTVRTAWTARSWFVLSTRDLAVRVASATTIPSEPPAR